MRKSIVHAFGCPVVPFRGTHYEESNYIFKIVGYRAKPLEVIA
jgi:hypothetical protein